MDRPEDVERPSQRLRAIEADGQPIAAGRRRPPGLDRAARRARLRRSSSLPTARPPRANRSPRPPSWPRKKGVPLFTIGLGSAEPARDLELTELLVDDVVFVDDAVRFQAKLLARGFQGQKVVVRLKERDPARQPRRRHASSQSKEVEPRRRPARRVELVHRPKTTGERTFILEVDKPPRAPDREQPDRARDHGPQGEAQGPVTSTASRATSSAI